MASFPKTLYVHEPLTSKDGYDGYPTWEDAEDSDVMAIYKLDRVVRVREKKEKVLEPVDVPAAAVAKEPE